MAVEITQNLTQVTISSVGVQGPKGETGEAGATQDVSMFLSSSTFNEFTSSIQSDVNSIKAWTASLELINTIDTELLQFYQTTASLNTQTGSQNSINLGISTATGSLIGITNGLMAFTAALDSTYASDVQLLPILQATRSIELHSGSIIGITNGLMAYTSSNESWKEGIRGEISAIEAWTASLELINTIDTELLQLYQTTASLNLKTGSYATTGSNTFNGNQTINGSIILDNGAIIKDTPNNGISFGYQAAEINQSTQSVAIGNYAGYQNQSNQGIAIGANAGALNQGQRAVALGGLAGSNTQGEYAVAIGNFAAPNNQAANSIVISAIGSGLENTTPSSLVIAPIRNVNSNDGVLQYNTASNEVSYATTLNGITNLATTGSNTFVGNQSISGSLNLSGSLTFTPSFQSDDITASIAEYRNGISIIAESTDTDGYAQLYWNGLPGTGNTFDGSDLYSWAYASGLGFQIQYKDVVNSKNFQWHFDTNGDLSVARNIKGVLNLATTGSNQFSGSQYIISGGLVFNNGVQLYENDSDLYIQSLSEIRVGANGNNYKFGNDGNFYTSVGGVVFSHDGLINQIPGASGDNINIVVGINDGIVLTTDAGDGDYAWDFDKNGDLTVPGNVYGATNLATNGGNIFNGNQIIAGTLLVSGSTYFNGDKEITGSVKITGSVTIDNIDSAWTFREDGVLKLNDGTAEIYADPNVYSLRIGTAPENVAPNTQIILGGSQSFKIKSGPPLRQWDFDSINGDFNLTGSINGAGNLATTGSNTFNGNQIITGSLNVSGSTTQIGNNILTGNTVLSGSISISGSTTFNGVHTLSGTNTIIGNTEMSGSINVSGSSNFHNSVFIVTGSSFFTGSHEIRGNSIFSGSINIASGSSYYRAGNKLFNYGQWASLETQSGSANTAYAMKLETITDGLSGFYVGNNASGFPTRIYAQNTGLYNIQFSAQLHTTANQAVDFSVWFAMTGSAIAYSNTDFSIEKIAGGGFQVAALNFLTPISSGSYVELYWSKTTAQGQLQAKGVQASPTRPATPSAIVTVTQVA